MAHKKSMRQVSKATPSKFFKDRHSFTTARSVRTGTKGLAGWFASILVSVDHPESLPEFCWIK